MVGMLSFTLHTLLFIFHFSFINPWDLVDKCQTDNGRSLSAWNWEVRTKNNNYSINLCKKAANCNGGVSICKKDTDMNYGSSVKSKVALPTLKYAKYGFSITFNGTNSDKPNKCDKNKYQSQIIFHCDKILGFPEIVQETECLLIFEFFTNEACATKPTETEIPCSLYDQTDGLRRDFSPLIKQTGGHLVASSERGVEIYINVCRSITNYAKIPVASCAKGSTACRIDKKVAIGQITNDTKLHYVNGKVTLTYTMPKKPKECADIPMTTITFVCPKHFSDAGIGPVLTSSTSSCQYEIEWRTDYACPDRDILTSNCTFTNGEVSFDLTRLEKPNKKESYGVETKDYIYRIKVCSNGQPCGSDTDGKNTAVCQINRKDHSQDKSCGDANYRKVRYADRNLTLIYKNGKSCHNGILRTTIINFLCDPKADVGAPTFLAEEHCHYFFEWRTRHVCLSRKPGACSVITMVNKKQATYDLSVLTKTGKYWIALNNHKETAGYTYYINICGAVSTQYKECDGAAACEVYKGKARGIGNYNNPPDVSSSGDLKLNYTGGECEGFGRRISTIIKFICKYKNMESPPELESKSWDGCEYIFTWSTAAACSLHVASGKDCVLEDPITGYVFDLSDLKKGPNGDSKPNYFSVPADKATFNIAVCGSLDKEACGNRESNIGACQKTGSSYINAGVGNSKLYYYDGKMNLTYTDGKKCSRGNKPRSTHITFFCDENIKIGKPEFEKEDYCTYHFVWYTSYACPSKALECLAKSDKGKEYDLSSLVKTDGNWMIKDKEGWTYYINVCRVLHHGDPATKGCPGTSAVCAKDPAGTYINLGEVSGPLTVLNKGVLSLSYQAGKCRTIITFICLKSDSEGGPRFVSANKTQCIYNFRWLTRAACAVEPHLSSACGANDVSISQLAKPLNKYYTVKGPSFTIQFNICKNITCGSDKTSTACLIDNKGKQLSLGRSLHSMIENRGDMIVLRYPNGYFIDKKEWGLYAVTVINFICARNVTVRKPVFRSQEENVYTIDFLTPVACPAGEVQCSFYNASSNTRYDLSPLKLTKGNWMAADTRAHLDYYINICKAYNPAGLSPSCSGAVGGCQLDKKSKKAHSMGLVRGDPFLYSTGDLTLIYTGGEKCHTIFHRSTRLNFFCSSVHGSPVFMIETVQCEYLFNWKTPSACPLVEKTGNEHCQVYDSVYGVRYDLGDLQGLLRNLTLDNGDVLQVGFCGPIPKKYGKDIGACVEDKDGKISKTFKNSKITYYNDAITIKHMSKGCNITSKIYCGTQLLSEGDRSSNHDGSVCNMEVDWQSKLACRPLRGEECSLTYNGVLYDLSVLAKEAWNWRARVAVVGYSEYQFYISVCKPLIINKQLRGLRDGSRAAVIEPKGKVTSLGTMTQPLSMSNGFLTMTYGLGESFSGCDSGLVVHIQFVCDSVPEGVAGEPVLDGFDKVNCVLHFTWVTKAACGVRSQVVQDPPGKCMAIHPATMKSIDLNKLHSKNGYTLKDQKGDTYKLSVCAAASSPGKGCPAAVGMCKKVSATKYQSVGLLNTTLVYRQGFLYLSYKSGDKCSAWPGNKMETLISFICDRTVTGKGQPKLQRVSDCTHYVTWRTHLACEAEVECVASKGNQFYDLSPLIKNNGNYEVFSNGKKYFINVCRSLASEPGCSSQAAVCAGDELGKNQISDMGHVNSPPVIVDSLELNIGVKVRLVYSDGSCKRKDGGTRSTNTTIEFVCDQNEGLGEPSSVITDEYGCSGLIMWRTSLVCKPETFESKSCIFHHPNKRYCFDLRKLSSGPHVNVVIPGGKANFDICGTGDKMPTGCKNSEVCVIKDDKPVSNKKDTRKIQYSGREVRINYDNAVIIIYCGENKQSEGPQYIGEDKAKKYVFNWVSSLVCPPRELSCIIEDGKATYDLGILTKQTSSYYLVDDNRGDRYRINICGNVPSSLPSMCSSRITAWRNTSKGVVEVIAKDTEQKLELKPHEDFPIRLNYTSDTTVKDCEKIKPSVMHKFKCASVTFPPSLERFDPKHCLFIFLWRTPGACAEKRTPMKCTGDWIFYDARSSFCDLDLGILRRKISAVKRTKDCVLVTPRLYSEGEVFELDVTCTRKDQPSLTIHISIHCNEQQKNSTLFLADYNSKSKVFLSWETDRVCNGVRLQSCSKTKASLGKKAAEAVIGTLLAIGIIAAILFFACKPEKRDSAVLWIRWHVRKYICCKASYQASYRYKKVNTGDSDGETDFIIEANVGTVFSSDEDEDDDDNDDDLLPLDDDLLNLDEA